LHATMHSTMFIKLLRGLVLTVSAIILIPSAKVLAGDSSFSDVPERHPAFEAIENLKERGIISGYPDGKFRPNNNVNRAEALKLIVAPIILDEQLSEYSTSSYEDVPNTSWFFPYTERAFRNLKIIDGPPVATSFFGERTVNKVEFLKMLILANNADPQAFNEIDLPLTEDVNSAEEWYYPYMRYSLSASLITTDENKLLNPDEELTRADTALILYNFLEYSEKKRTQATLSSAEKEIIYTLERLSEDDIENAKLSSVRALLYARGANSIHPDEVVVQSTVKITEGFRALVEAYIAGTKWYLEDVITHAGQAWDLADSAKNINPDLIIIANELQRIAKSMADDARSNRGE
jgi:hypothetical protein